MLRQLIVNADDFGYSPGVTQGILRAHLDGIVTSSSVMINMSAAEESIEIATNEAPTLGLGLHLNITAGKPLSLPEKVPALVDAAGQFKHKADIAQNLGAIPKEQFEREFRTQFERFFSVAGKPPDHLDSHHHISYLHPAIVEVMLTLAEEVAIPVRSPLPRNPDSAAELLKSLGLLDPNIPVSALIQDLQSLLSDSNVKTPDNFITSFFGDKVALGDLLNILVDLPDGRSELMCHPALVDTPLADSSGYIEPRMKELESLTHPAVRELINAEFIQLINFQDLK